MAARAHDDGPSGGDPGDWDDEDDRDRDDDERRGPVEEDLGNAVLMNDAAVQNTFAATGLLGFALVPIAAGLVILRRWLRQR